MIQSPMNYTGGKYKLLPQILPHFPKEIETFVDLFCGGCNVGINVKAKKHIYNDADEHLLYLYNTFKNLDKESTFKWIDEIITEYGLSRACDNGYEFYGCESGKGLGNYNKAGFLRLRDDFNKTQSIDYYYYIKLFVLITYAFNNQIRFNSKGEYNLPVGKRDFNSKMASKLSAFIDTIKQQNCSFSCLDFRQFNYDTLKSNDFVYADPPYLITCATYNENSGWTDSDEQDLLSILDSLNDKGIRFALSNVLRTKGKENEILIRWSKKNKKRVRVIPLDYCYANSNYQTKNKDSTTEEVLIVNY